MSRPYWWFDGDSVQQLIDQLLLVNPKTARLEVHLVGQDMTLHVKDTAAVTEDEGDPVNASHVCPPDCG